MATADEADDATSQSARLSDVAYARIVASIAAQDYALGSKLPTELELAATIGVSRPVVREALQRLREDGVVLSRRGSGTYIKRVPRVADPALAPLASVADMRQCLEFRISFEGEAAWHAASQLPGDDAELVAAMARLETEIERGEVSVASDFAFHLAVAKGTGNRFFEGTLQSLGAPITTGMTITRNFELLGTAERLRELHDEHCAIFAAVRAREPGRARDAMRRHLQNAMRRAFEGTV